MRIKPYMIGVSACLAMLTVACKAPPSVQKIIDEKQAEEAQRSGPKLDNPVVAAAREEGREAYNRHLIGKWSATGVCDSAGAVWEFTQDSYRRPFEPPCRLELVESLQDGSYAAAGYCPQLETADVADVVVFTRTGSEKIIIPGNKGGPLSKC